MNRMTRQADMAEQGTRRKKILLCVIGVSPRVITQTVYGLVTQEEPWIPDEVIAITTRIGREVALQRLFKENHFNRLLQYLDITYIDFPPRNIEVIRKAKPPYQELDDILSPDENSDAGEFILKRVLNITEADDSELIVSLSGGRHTMSFFAGYALSLLGRRQDNLIQVLVPDGLDKDRTFFFPDDQERDLPEGQKAEVLVAKVPFARLENLDSLRMIAGRVDFATLCKALEEKAHLEIFEEFRRLVFKFSRAFEIPCDSGHDVVEPRLEPRAAALYYYYAWRAKNGMPFISDAEIIADPDRLLEIYRDQCPSGVREKWRKTITSGSLVSARHKIENALIELIKDGAKYDCYKIHRKKYRLVIRGLKLDPSQIEFIDHSVRVG